MKVLEGQEGVVEDLLEGGLLHVQEKRGSEDGLILASLLQALVQVVDRLFRDEGHLRRALFKVFPHKLVLFCFVFRGGARRGVIVRWGVGCPIPGTVGGSVGDWHFFAAKQYCNRVPKTMLRSQFSTRLARIIRSASYDEGKGPMQLNSSL